jgi:hypothetical protein
MKPAMLVIVAALLAAGSAHAQPVSLHVRTAGDLAEMCAANPHEPTGPARLNYCSGFAQGAVDVEFRHAGEHKPFCIPPNARREVTLHEFAEWVRASPSRRAEDAIAGLFRFLAERFPCR